LTSCYSHPNIPRNTSVITHRDKEPEAPKLGILNFLSWREQEKSFEDLAAVAFANYTLTGNGEPEQVAGNRISPALIRMLGVAPIAGRVFYDSEESPGAGPVVMLGEKDANRLPTPCADGVIGGVRRYNRLSFQANGEEQQE
jgi:hypothetical protein